MKATRECSINGCTNDARTRGWCNAHYNRQLRNGEIEPLPSLSLTERLAAHLVAMPNGCIEWTLSTNCHGYGQIGRGGRTEGKASTHRLAWELANGPISDGLHVLHHCDNPPCCQTDPTDGYPDGHLFLGTRSDNMVDMISKGRSRGQKVTHCPKGHKYTPENTYVRPANNSRHCRKCVNAAKSRWQKKRRLARVEAA